MRHSRGHVCLDPQGGVPNLLIAFSNPLSIFEDGKSPVIEIMCTAVGACSFNPPFWAPACAALFSSIDSVGIWFKCQVCAFPGSIQPNSSRTSPFSDCSLHFLAFLRTYFLTTCLFAPPYGYIFKFSSLDIDLPATTCMRHRFRRKLFVPSVAISAL
jgi:hypothetical protein